MSLRDDILTDAQAAWFDTDGLAQTVTYKAVGSGTGMAIQAILTFGANLKDQGRYRLEEMTALVPQAAVAAPRDGDTITLADGAVWTVRGIEAGDVLGIGWQLRCTKGERPAQRRAGA